MAHDVNQSEEDVAAQVRTVLVSRISAERYELWIAPETQWHWSSGTLTVSFESDFACQLARRMVGKDVAAALQFVAGPQAALHLVVTPVVVTPAEHVGADGQADSLGSADVTELATVKTEKMQRMTLALNRPTNPRDNSSPRDNSAPRANEAESDPPQILTLPTVSSAHSAAKLLPSTTAAAGPREGWERFVAGDCNQLAWTTANMVVAQPGRMTPVLFHGPCGVGKTHLMAAIAQQLRTHCRLRRVAHMTCEQFTNDFTEAIKGGGLPMFRRKYRDVDALLVDDVHFLIGKKATIGELKNTLDNLLRIGKQVIFSADRPLNDLHLLGQEIVGRLRGGLVSPLMPVDEKTRATLLHRELADSGIELGSDIVQQIASRTVGDGRVIHGIVKRLVAMAMLTGKQLSWEQCWNSVYDLVQATQPVVRLGDIERVVCEVFGLEPTSLQSTSKARTVAQPRMLAMFLARKYTPAAYKEIGDYFGKRRHSTVISAEKTVEEWLRANASLGDARGLSARDALRHVESNLQVG